MARILNLILQSLMYYHVLWENIVQPILLPLTHSLVCLVNEEDAGQNTLNFTRSDSLHSQALTPVHRAS